MRSYGRAPIHALAVLGRLAAKQFGRTVLQKLLALPIACRRFLNGFPIPSPPYFRTSAGFAFAGDVLPAMMTYATAATFLQNLAVPPQSSIAPPRLSEITSLVCTLGSRFSKEALSASNGSQGSFQAAIFGWDHCVSAYAIYHLIFGFKGGSFYCESSELFPKDENDVTILANQSIRGELKNSIDRIRVDGDSLRAEIKTSADRG